MSIRLRRIDIDRLAYAATLSVALACVGVTVGCSGTPTQASLGEVVDDTVITSKVKAAFVDDKDVSALDISVTTFKGVVQLTGFVNSRHEKLRASELAWRVRGVKTVNNDIRVKAAG